MKMNAGVRFRLVALAAGVGLLGLLIGLMTLYSQSQSGQLRSRLRRVDSESFRIADEFRDFLRQVNNALYDFGNQHDPTDRDQFLKASHELDLWIDDQKPKLITTQEQDLMGKIAIAYNDYLAAATALLKKMEAETQPGGSMANYSELRKQSQHLFDLGQSLAKAHFESRSLVLAEANQTITALRHLVLIALAGMFVLGIALAWFVYRDMIAPLETRLVESQSRFDRQEKLASLGLLAAGVAHELRNPLTAIKAALFIQQKRFQAGTPEYSDTAVVEREILRLERIVNDFLLFARPAEPQLASVPVAGVLQDVKTLLAPQLAGTHIQLLVTDPPPCSIRADAAQIKQVLINLIRNAADAVGKDGVVRLSARADRRKSGQGSQDVVVLEVADNGPGIPADIEKRLFDPFFTTKENGTGLGLSIAAGIVEKHGGALQYQTQVAKGTTFGIILPQATA